MKNLISVTRPTRLTRSAKKQEGVVLILFAVSLVVIAGFAAISIDSGRAYGTKARLAAATDAAAIAGVRNLANGATDAARIANAQAGATQFFNLNFPQNTGGATVAAPITNVIKQANGQWRVTVNAQATLPTTFARVLGFNETPIATMGQTIRRDLDLMMVFDSSGSMRDDIDALKTAAKQNFLNKFIPGPGGDRVGFVSYAVGSEIDVAIDRTMTRGFNRQTVENAIDAMMADGRTATSEGLRKGFEELQAIPAGSRSSLRVMLLFSDGAPNIFGTTVLRSGVPVEVNWRHAWGNTDVPGPTALADFENPDITSGGPVPGGTPPTPSTIPAFGLGGVPTSGRRNVNSGFTSCNMNRVARNMMENAADRARAEGIVVYTVGLGSNLQAAEQASACGYTAAEESGELLLKRAANTTDSDTFNSTQPEGLYCWAADQTKIDNCFEQISRSIIRLTL